MWTGIDMLVRLYDLPPVEPLHGELKAKSIAIRRPRAYEKLVVLDWVGRNFNHGWQGECDVTFSRDPVSTFIATQHGSIVGFVCYDATYRNFFGPLGVAESHRSANIGTALTLFALHAMAASGYAYAIIGGPSDAVGFYERCAGAIAIPGSSPGIYICKRQSESADF